MEMEYANTKQKSMKPSSVCPLGPSGVKYSTVNVSVKPPHFEYLVMKNVQLPMNEII